MNYEVLLSHADFIRAIARSLVRDENTQDDMVQETWLAALRQKDGEIRSLPAWLATVTRNFARLDLRGHARRARREKAAAQGEALASTEEVVQREAMRRQVVDTVLALKEPYRSAVLYRFYEDLPPREIARRLNIPAATARSHIHRGLEQMRSRLDREYGNDRRAWCRAMAPLAGIKVGSALSSTAGPLTAMAVVLIVSTVLIWSFVTGEPDPLPSKDLLYGRFTAEAEDETGGTPAAPRKDIQERERIPATVSENRDEISLTGRLVREEDGSPVAGVMIRPGFSRESGVDFERPEALTDRNGRFAFLVPRPCALKSIHIHSGLHTIETVVFLNIRLTPGEHEITLKVPGGGSVQGVVQDHNGFPVPGAVVKGWCCWSYQTQGWAYGKELAPPHRGVVADGQGRFLMKHLGRSFLITAEAPGMVCRWRLYGEMKTGQEARDLTLTLGPEQVLRGRVITPQGKPVQGVKVLAKTPMRKSDVTATDYLEIHRAFPLSVETVTNERGEFALAPLAPLLEGSRSRPYNIKVKHAPYLPWSTSPENFDKPLEIMLEAGATVTGRICDFQGRPVHGAEVRVHDYSNRPSLATDKKGGFTIQGLVPAEKAWISVTAPGMALRMEEHGPLENGKIRYVDFRLEPELVLAGTLLDGRGRPVPEGHVTIKGDRISYHYGMSNGTWESTLGMDKTRTDEQGRFRFEGLYDGRFTIFAAGREDPEAVVELKARSGSENLEITLDLQALRKVVLRGRVTDARTGLPIERFEITPMREVPRNDGMTSFEGTPHPFDSPEGLFEIAGLSEGDIHVTVSAEGYLVDSLPGKDFASGEHQVDFSLTSGRSLQVRVLDGDGRPVKDAHVQFKRGASLTPPPKTRSARFGLPTDEEGKTLLHLLPADKVVLWVFAPGISNGAPYPVDLWHPMEGVLDLVLTSTAKTVILDLGVMGTSEEVASGPVDMKDMSMAGRMQSLFAAGGIWFMDASFTVVIHDKTGAEIERLLCERISADRWRVTRDGHPPIETNRPHPTFRVPREAVSIEVEARGYEKLEINLDPIGSKTNENNCFRVLGYLKKKGG
jgi:RNA polymerase sigma factor (sigma-70 family)